MSKAPPQRQDRLELLLQEAKRVERSARLMKQLAKQALEERHSQPEGGTEKNDRAQDH